MNKHVALDQKLTVLQDSDALRKWVSLDEERICILCDRVISGRMIDVWQDQRGGYHLHCPTPGCAATPRDWFHHGLRRAPRQLRPRRASLVRLRTASA